MILAGQTVGGRFEVRRRLGAGGMGEVFEAFDRDRGAVVAIKMLTRADGDTLARFKREFRAMQSTAHPNLVSIGELLCIDELWMFTMELVEGRHFIEHVRAEPAQLRASLHQLVIGLCALHHAGFVHRDIKPPNVMVTPEGRVVLLDFGLVTNLDPAQQSIASGPIGTVEYMAPEQATGRQVGEAADWYAVGVMLYEALTHKMPHVGYALQILVAKQQVEPTPPHEIAPDAPRDLCTLCMDLLAIEPTARPTGPQIAHRLGIELAPVHSSSTPSAVSAFVGRETERAELERSAARARSQPLVHLVVGESGIGKSELVSRFVRQLAIDDPRTMVLGGRCYERESVPYKAFDGIADELAEALSAMTDAEVRAVLPARPPLLAQLFPVFQRVEAIATSPALDRAMGEPHEHRRRMFRAFRDLLARLARTRRVVITIDDLQWANADSFLLLRQIFRGAGAPSLLVIATMRGEDSALATSLEGLPIERTQVGPLTAAECRALADKLVPGASIRFDLERLTREAAGHPMFLQELLRHLELAGATGQAKATLDDALSARVALLGPDARALLDAVCIAGAPISLEVAARACRLEATTVTRASASLRVAMLVREIQRGRQLALEPYHDRVREAIGSRIDEHARRELHARVAYALESGHDPGDPQLLLRNFLLGEVPERAARYAEQAAERSEAAHAFDQAAELWHTALDIIARTPEDRRRVLLRLGNALINAGRGAEAATHYLAAAVDADRATRLECQRRAAEQLVISGHIAPGIAALQSLVTEIGVTWPKGPRRAIMSLLWNRGQVRARGLKFRERHRREISDATMLELEVLKVAAHSLAMIDSIRGMDFQTRHLLMALKTGHRDHIVRALLIESMFHATGSNHRRARQLFDHAVAIGGDTNDPYVSAMLAGARGAGAYFAGDIVAAMALMDETVQTLKHVPGNNWEAASARLIRLYAMRFIGDSVAMRATYEEYILDAVDRGNHYLESTMRRVCVSMWLAEDDVDGAVGELEGASWVPPLETFHVQHFHELIGWAEIGLYRGALDPKAQLAERFARLDDSMLLRVESVRVQNDYLRGRLALAGQLPGASAARFARRLGGEPNPLAATWSLVLQAGELARSDRARAASLYDRAAETAHRAGMQATAAAARWRLATLRDDADLRAEAEAKLAELGVRDVERTAMLLVPLQR